MADVDRTAESLLRRYPLAELLEGIARQLHSRANGLGSGTAAAHEYSTAADQLADFANALPRRLKR